MLLSQLHEHENANFVLEKPENGGSEGQKSTKTSILCSGGREGGPGRQELALCRQELPSGSVIVEKFTITVAFLQITAHAPKI